MQKIILRQLQKKDIKKLARTFVAPWQTYETGLKIWQKYFQEQEEGIRTACLIESQSEFLGYCSLLRLSEYPFFREKGIPEINALWIKEEHRRKGLGTKLITHLEKMAHQEGHKIIGIGVGLYKDYGAAQKLYVKLGYIPDGHGATYKYTSVIAGECYHVDDDLIIWLTKSLE